MSSDGDQEFLRRAESLMAALLAKLDEIDPDELEADSAAGVIKMVFADRGPHIKSGWPKVQRPGTSNATPKRTRGWTPRDVAP